MEVIKSYQFISSLKPDLDITEIKLFAEIKEKLTPQV